MLSSISNIYTATTSIGASLALTATQNYLKPNSFRFQIAKLPNITYTCQSANLPPLVMSAAQQNSPFVDIPHPGDKIVFGEFNIKFLINEDMSNYKELYDWIVSMGVPSRGEQWGQLGNRASTFDADKYQSNFSDANLIILNSNNNPVVRLNFQDLFPVSIEGLEFDLTTAGMEYFVGIAAFRYKLFTVTQY
jgi:hypothetical protein